ncbi:hypothetical protein [Kitasatospora azatica]|uniref:hypothetical protein n=1 Tax=Kitasatospora azatica TaxID=58347 RepID=UPI0006916CF4|nr:hypothetical protein [Kitasatospora azatica]
MNEILRLAGDLLGRQLTEPVDLGGSRRSAVLRCRTTDGASVIVKAFDEQADARRAFAGEAAGLSLGLAGPELLAVDPDARLLVMADLGAVPTLADLLLGDDPKAAERALLEWSRGLGRLAVRSVAHRAEFAEHWARYDPGMPSWDEDPWVEQNAARLPGVLAMAGLDPAPGLAEELARIGTAGGERYPAFTPGDTCPDNNLITPDGLRLIDFEGAGYVSVFLTAAYCRMPFATCWCVFELPPELAAEAEQAYRAEVVQAYPELAEDALWSAGMEQAIAVWTVDVTVRALSRALTEDWLRHPTRRPVPTMRQLLRHRWEQAATLTGHPAFAETMRRLLREVADGWDLPPLGGYPALPLTPGVRAGS